MNDEHEPGADPSDEFDLAADPTPDLVDTDGALAPLEPATDDISTPEEVETATSTPMTTVYKGSGFRWSMLFGAVLVAVVIIMVVQNTQTTQFDFLQWSISAPLAALLLGTTLIAVVIDEIVGYVIRMRRRRVKRQLAELKELKAQLAPPKERRFGKKKP